MNESFETRPLLDRETLRALQQRQDASSLIHLVLHLGAFSLGVGLVIFTSPFPVVAAVSAVLLGAVWASLLAPFHECIHLTAFRSRPLNTFGAWLTGVSFSMAPAVYRAFHFEHHRHTQDPNKDPEIALAPFLRLPWLAKIFGWLVMIPGMGVLFLKAIPLIGFSVLPYSTWDRIAPWATPEQRSRIAWETRVVALVWAALIIAAVLGIPGMGWLIVAALISNLFLTLWNLAEHGRLPHEGSILTRTRTMQPSPFIRWWLWNMNYHAEHHAWPAIPWHQLPTVHERVAEHLDHQGRGYWRLQLDALRHRIFRTDPRLSKPGRGISECEEKGTRGQ